LLWQQQQQPRKHSNLNQFRRRINAKGCSSAATAKINHSRNLQSARLIIQCGAKKEQLRQLIKQEAFRLSNRLLIN
jgi:hypothetical protein